MSTLEILNNLLIVALIVVTSCIVLITYFLVMALKAIIRVANNLEQTTEGWKDKIQLKALAMVPSLIVALISNIFKKRG